MSDLDRAAELDPGGAVTTLMVRVNRRPWPVLVTRRAGTCGQGSTFGGFAVYRPFLAAVLAVLLVSGS